MSSKFLGLVLETFTMGNKLRVLVIDGDCSKDLKYGKSIEVHFASGSKTKVVVFDGFLQSAEKFHSATSNQVSSLSAENLNFPEYKEIIGAKVYLAD